MKDCQTGVKINRQQNKRKCRVSEILTWKKTENATNPLKTGIKKGEKLPFIPKKEYNVSTTKHCTRKDFPHEHYTTDETV